MLMLAAAVDGTMHVERLACLIGRSSRMKACGPCNYLGLGGQASHTHGSHALRLYVVV